MIAGAAEVAVIGRALLLALDTADAAIHVQNHAIGRMVAANHVDPLAGQ